MTLPIRWLIGYLLLIIISTIVLDIIVSKSIQENLTNQIASNLDKNLQLVQQLEAKVPPTESIDSLAKQIGKQLNVRVTFIDITGKVLGDTDVPTEEVPNMENHKSRPEVMKAMGGIRGESIRFSHTIKNDLMYVAIPWKKNGKMVGVIRMAIPLTQLQETLSDARKIVYSGSAIALLLATMMGLYFAYSLTKPIRQMINAAELIAQEKFSHKLPVDTHGELKVLADSLNTMSTKLETRFRDVHDEKQKLEAVLASMTEGVMVLDNRGKIALTNNALTQMLNLTSNPLDRMPIEIIRNPDATQSLMDALKKGEFVQKEITLTGGGKTIRLYAAPLMEENKIQGLVTVFHDITDIRTLEQIRRDFVANVSHELKTPLTTIQGFAETLLDGALDDKDYSRKFVQNIYTQTQRMTALVEDLLCLSRIESGKTKMILEPIDIREIVKSSQDIIQPRAEQKGVTLKFNLPKQPLMIPADRKYLEQMLINLMDNAIKFSNPKSEVAIEVNKLSTGVEIKVTDSGIGIPSEDLPRIFERFYRVDKSRSNETQGTGLGLAIAKHIAEAHLGTIQAQSILGKGTTFVITLPFSAQS